MNLLFTRMIRKPECISDIIRVLNHENYTLAAGELLLVGSESESAVNAVPELRCSYQDTMDGDGLM
jgi:hypothetical protein